MDTMERESSSNTHALDQQDLDEVFNKLKLFWIFAILPQDSLQ